MQYGVKPELVELARIPHVKASRAQQLYKAGLRTVKDVAGSSVDVLERAIARGNHVMACVFATPALCFMPHQSRQAVIMMVRRPLIG